MNKFDPPTLEELIEKESVKKQLPKGRPRHNTVSKTLYEEDLDHILDTVDKYIRGTYGEHYVGNGNIQEIDAWESRGSLQTTSRDTCSKYLTRFGKKGGNNQKDLLKAFHYLILMYYAAETEGFTPQ